MYVVPSSQCEKPSCVVIHLTLLTSPSVSSHQLYKEQDQDVSLEQDPVREQSTYLSRKQRQQLLDEHDVQGWTIVQFLGDSVLIPAGAMFQVQSRHPVSVLLVLLLLLVLLSLLPPFFTPAVCSVHPLGPEPPQLCPSHK